MFRRKIIKRSLKVSGILLMLLLLGAYMAFDSFINPRSDQEILADFEDAGFEPNISYHAYKQRDIRVLTTRQNFDANLPLLVLVHGSPGSAMDFKRYLMDPELNSMANLLAYDRPGYSYADKGMILGSLEEEINLLEDLLSRFQTNKVILAGYSYGGTVVMGSTLNFKKKIALAAAVRGELEPLFWALNLTKWKMTKPLVPKVFQAAAKEKFRHLTELGSYEETWGLSSSPVLSIHGKKDRIVPYQNSLFLKSLFAEEKFELISLENGNHSLIWTNFDLIKSEIINSLK